jgi:hypothetical protein
LTQRREHLADIDEDGNDAAGQVEGLGQTEAAGAGQEEQAGLQQPSQLGSWRRLRSASKRSPGQKVGVYWPFAQPASVTN